ncbi:MAG: S9 family peptidase [Candidatus Eisenbacteria bacterium]|uniref:S9 family peptidase n=1 Tax=Eiseniibacteriota bacterium TaxID=2212470 RepID=A0A849SFF5_UNCEI|nr:S9 family peptidase [Candidatus Eisenbacteria bacterium]
MTPETASIPDAARAPNATGARRPMREDDLLRFVWVADPQISPDGARVAFTRVWVDRESDDYQTAVWIADAKTGGARALTSGKWDSQPRWSPDGTRLAFVRKTAGDQPPQLHVLPMAGGEAQCLTTLEKGAGAPAWSPDGTRIAFTSGTNPEIDTPEKTKNKPKHEPARIVQKPVFRWNDQGFVDLEHLDQLWVIPAAGGSPRQLTRGEFAAGAPRWSRDGRRVMFAADRRAEPWFGHEEARLYSVSPELESPTTGEALELVADYSGTVIAWAEREDGAIATIGKLLDSSRFASYDQMDVLLSEGASPLRKVRRVNATRDHAMGETLSADQHPPRGGGGVPFAFAENGRVILTLASRHGGAMLVRVDLASGEVRELTPIQRDISVGSATPDGRRWALTVGSPTTPGDLAIFDTANGELRTLYAPNQDWLAEIALGAIEEIWYPSFDGKQIQGWMVRPPDFDPKGSYPLVLEIHGGPHTAYGVAFFHEFQVLAGAGYVVLYTNPRGSTSYGESFADCIQYRYPGDDVQDLLLGVDEVVKRGSIDVKRLGVTGGSGGGLLTNWIIAHDQRFAAAVTQRCVADWISMVYSSDFALFMPYWFRRQPHEDPKEYLDRSPYMMADRIQTPLMVIHSEEDWRTPIGQGETMFRALLQQRKTCVMVRFPGENHELSRSGMPTRRVQNQEHIRAWFDRWLQGKPAPQYGV